MFQSWIFKKVLSNFFSAYEDDYLHPNQEDAPRFRSGYSFDESDYESK